MGSGQVHDPDKHAKKEATEVERERCKRLVLSAGDKIVSSYTMELLIQIAAKIEGKEIERKE